MLNIAPLYFCLDVGLDIQDDLGRHEVGFVDNTDKQPVGNDGEGCRFKANFKINKVYAVCVQIILRMQQIE